MLAQTLSLKGRALRLLAAREHSRAELEQKLKPQAQANGQLEQLAQILDDLEARDFINQGRVVESLLNRRAGRLGSARLRHELNQKGIGRDAVDQAIEGLKSTELERARQVRLKKFGAAAGDAKQRARQMRFLLARGFSAEDVRRAVLPAGLQESGPKTESAPSLPGNRRSQME
jgi:regulatory protein